MKRAYCYLKSLNILKASPAIVMTKNMDVDETDSYRSATLRDMYGAHGPWNSPEFPMIPPHPAAEHAVIYDYRGVKADVWSHNKVRMPFAKDNVYDNKKLRVASFEVSRWDVIKKALKKKITNVQELESAIMKYNQKFLHYWRFDGLRRYFNQYLRQDEADKFFKHTLPRMVELALMLPDSVKVSIPMLQKGSSKSISLSQMQIASLLANAFFCTFPRRNDQGPSSEYKTYPKINFNSLFECDSDGAMEKLRCIIHYFDRVIRDNPQGVVTFSRRHVSSHNCPRWDQSEVKISSIKVLIVDDRMIEDIDGLIQVDFANKFLGGGVLGSGCVQEEIRFVISPELMLSMLFTEELGDNEAVMVLGSERYSSYEGYGRSEFKYTGNYVDKTPRDSSGRRRNAVLAIDAKVYHDEKTQYSKPNIRRELNKAWIGFSFYTDPKSKGPNYPGVVTGNWGCGAFGGSHALKSLLQLAACACAGRPLMYVTFGDTQLKEELTATYKLLCDHDVTVGQLYHLITKYYHAVNKGTDLHTFLKDQLTKRKSALSIENEASDPIDYEEFEDASDSPVEDFNGILSNNARYMQSLMGNGNTKAQSSGTNTGSTGVSSSHNYESRDPKPTPDYNTGRSYDNKRREEADTCKRQFSTQDVNVPGTSQMPSYAGVTAGSSNYKTYSNNGYHSSNVVGTHSKSASHYQASNNKHSGSQSWQNSNKLSFNEDEKPPIKKKPDYLRAPSCSVVQETVKIYEKRDQPSQPHLPAETSQSPPQNIFPAHNCDKGVHTNTENTADTTHNCDTGLNRNTENTETGNFIPITDNLIDLHDPEDPPLSSSFTNFPATVETTHNRDDDVGTTGNVETGNLIDLSEDSIDSPNVHTSRRSLLSIHSFIVENNDSIWWG